MNERDKGKDGQLLHEEYEWHCNEYGCKTGYKSIDYGSLYNMVESHSRMKQHHSGRLTIIKVVETWK